LLAHVRLIAPVTADPSAVRRQRAIALRRTDRRPFADVEVPQPALARLLTAAAAEGGHLYLLGGEETRLFAALAALAAAAQDADAGYRAELAAWLSRPTAAGDGIPDDTAAGGPPRIVPVRDFAPGRSASASRVPGDRCARYGVLFTATDDEPAWLTAGEALSAVLLTATID